MAKAKWDEGMKAGKLLIALMDPSLNYRADIRQFMPPSLKPPPNPLQSNSTPNLEDTGNGKR